MKTLLKIIGYGFLAFMAIGIIGALMDDGKSSETTTKEAAVEEAAPRKPEIELVKFNATNAGIDGGVYVHCKIKNNTDKLASYVGIKVTFYDKDGNIVGTGMGNTSNLPAGKDRTVDAMAMNIYDSEKYEVEIDQVHFQ